MEFLKLLYQLQAYRMIGAEQPVSSGSNELLTIKLRYKEPNGDTSKKSEFKGNATYDKVIALAKTGLDNDERATIAAGGVVPVKTTGAEIVSGYLKTTLPMRRTSTTMAKRVMPPRKIQCGVSPNTSCNSSIRNSMFSSSFIVYNSICL
jgi:hypothetical protein